MRIVAGTVLAFLAGLTTSPVRAVPATTNLATSATFDGWTATCDNLRSCVAIGSSDDGDGLFYVRVAMAAGATARPLVKVVLAAADPIPGAPDAFRLALERGGVDDRYTVPATKDDPDGAALAGEIKDAAFLPAIAKAQALGYVVGTLKGKLVLKGLAQALSFIDDRQGRAATSSALIEPGTASLATVPPPPSPPVLVPADITAAAVATPNPSRALLDMAKPACDPEVVEARADAAAWTLGPDRRLVAVPCADSPTNVSAALFTTDAKGEQPRPAMLEQPPKQGDAEADNVVVNYEFDAKTLTLTSLDKARGLGDCGRTRKWVWTGELFALLEAADMEQCPGALPDDWPTVFRAARR